MFRIDQTVMNNNLDLGRAIAPFCSFINHACCPNVATIITDDRQIILYSVQSIEENEQVINLFYCLNIFNMIFTLQFYKILNFSDLYMLWFIMFVL